MLTRRAPKVTWRTVLQVLAGTTAVIGLTAATIAWETPNARANRHTEELKQSLSGQIGTPEAESTPVPFNAGGTKLHTTDLSPEQGRETTVTLIAENPADNPPVSVTINAQVPNGMQITQAIGENWVDPACVAQCAAEIFLSTGESNANNALTVIAGEPGAYTVTAESWWKTEGNPVPIQEPDAQLAITVSEVANSERADPVGLHADVTQAEEGSPISITLSMINSIGNLPMTAQAILEVPPGMSISGTGFAESCGARCNANHTLQPGENKSVLVTVTTNQPGDFVLKGYLEWYYGDDERNAGQAQHELLLKVRAKAVAAIPGTGNQAPPPRDDGNTLWEAITTLPKLILALIVLAVVSAIFGVPIAGGQTRRNRRRR